MAGRNFLHYVRLVSSIIGVIIGLLAAATFFIVYQHILASAWAFTSAIFAAVCLKLHILYHRNVLQAWHSSDTLSDIKKLGFIVFIISFAFTIWYIFDGLYYHRAMMPVEDSPYITAVWSFMTGKWGFFLWLNSRMYARILSSGTLPMLLGE